MNKLLISGVVATLGFVGKLFRDSYKEEKAIKEELKRKQEETQEAERQSKYNARQAKIEAEAKQILDEHTRLFSTITTSSDNYLKGV